MNDALASTLKKISKFEISDIASPYSRQCQL